MPKLDKEWIEQMLVFRDKEDEFWIEDWNWTKEQRTKAQNATFYKLFTDIWNHLWETKDDVHDYLLWWVFWTHPVKLWKITKEVNNEQHTSKLSKEQWIRFIDTILKFCERENIPVTITPREKQSLYESYN